MSRIPPRWVAATVLVLATAVIGAAAVVHRPRAVIVQTDESTAIIRTHRGTVGAVLDEIGVALDPRDRVTPARARPVEDGLMIIVRRASPVVLTVGGRKRLVMTASGTVAELLREARVRVRPGDRVLPAPTTALHPGAAVRVIRVETRILTRVERVPFAQVLQEDPTLPRGTLRVLQAGRAGWIARRTAIKTADGVVVERRDLEGMEVQPPQDRILLIGTRRVIATRGEFTGKEMLHMEATAYAPGHGRGVDGITAIGLRAGYGVVAVDPLVIPLGSRLFIEGYGPAVAGDVGGAIKGRRIDLGFATAREAYRFGRRPVVVYILSTPVARAQ